MSQTTPGREKITARVFSDPTCPWAFSASPAFRKIEWRYRDQIEWRLVMIGLSEPENPRQYKPWSERADFLERQRDRYGMPYLIEPKIRPVASARACQAIVASRMLHPGSEWRVFRTLQLLHFNSPILLDNDDHLSTALETVPGLDGLRILLAIDSPDVQRAYQDDRREARSAAGGPAHLQGRTAEAREGTRYTAPSVIFAQGNRRLEVGGFQPVEAYDVAIANLDPELDQIGPSSDPLEVLRLYPMGLTTQEVAEVMTPNLDWPDREGTGRVLGDLFDHAAVKRIPVGDDAVWLAA